MSEATIAYILKGYPRLSETFISQEIHMLEERGFRIEVFSLKGAREKERHPVVDQIRAKVTYIPEDLSTAAGSILGHNFLLLLKKTRTYISALLHALKNSILEQKIAPLKSFLLAAWLVQEKKLGMNGIRHLHTHFIHAPTELGFYAAKISGLSYSISAHAKDIYTSPLRQVRERVNAAKFLMTCTAYNVDFLRKQPGMPAEKIHRVYHGIDTKLFSPGKLPYSQSLNRLRLLTCARLVPKKGYPFVLDAVASFVRSGIPLVYDIYGSGPQEEFLREYAKSLDITEQVHFHGNITQTELIQLYRNNGIFVLGCLEADDGDRDGIPNALAEAMSMEMPVIATNISGIPELVENNISGILVESCNSAALMNAIARILYDPTLGDRLGISARARVKAMFESENCIELCSKMFAQYK